MPSIQLIHGYVRSDFSTLLKAQWSLYSILLYSTNPGKPPTQFWEGTLMILRPTETSVPALFLENDCTFLANVNGEAV